jgi:aromatic ring-opening dioxygenase LigB subunit
VKDKKNKYDCANKTIIISLHYVFLNKSITIILLKQLTHTITVWDYRVIHDLVDDYVRIKGKGSRQLVSLYWY